jgi:hypothetical protein
MLINSFDTKFLIEGIYLMKKMAAFGVVLIFVGVIIASVSTQVSERLSRYETVGTSTDGWEVKGYFQKMERLVLSFNPPNLEDIWPDIPVYIEIWPEGYYDKKTVFQVEYKRVLNYPTVNINIALNEGGLTVDESLSEIEGVTVYEGYYLANITVRPAMWNPPPNPTLKVKVLEKEYPYLFVLPIGISFIVIGAFSLIWGVKTKRKIYPKKRNK